MSLRTRCGSLTFSFTSGTEGALALRRRSADVEIDGDGDSDGDADRERERERERERPREERLTLLVPRSRFARLRERFDPPRDRAEAGDTSCSNSALP